MVLREGTRGPRDQRRGGEAFTAPTSQTAGEKTGGEPSRPRTCAPRPRGRNAAGAAGFQQHNRGSTQAGSSGGGAARGCPRPPDNRNGSVSPRAHGTLRADSGPRLLHSPLRLQPAPHPTASSTPGAAQAPAALRPRLIRIAASAACIPLRSHLRSRTGALCLHF